VAKVQYVLGVVEDVTERKQLDDQLRQAQKMEAVGNLTGGIAHDFNNLLTVIIGNLDLLREDVAGHVKAEQKIDTIAQAAERGADLTRHMLMFSRRQPLQAEEIDVNTLIAGTTRLLSRALGGNIAINARDAMPTGGALTIATRLAHFDAEYAAHHAEVAAGAYVLIAISDTGTGIPPDVVERIFEPFFTTKPTGQGTGLGLSMVYGFIRQSGGHIKVYSEVGYGTTFKLYLPLATGPASNAAARPSAPRQPATARRVGNQTILAVEDNPDLRATVARQLRDLGYRVCEAESASDALAVLGDAERVDLLFTDMMLPGGVNGKELATEARAKRPDLKVLFTSGFPGTSGRQETLLEPGDVLLSKPYHKHDLTKAIEAALSTPG
jgi:CheY-like chemotaxis protein